MSKLSEAFKQLMANQEEAYSMVCTVKSVDEDARTCNVEPLNGDADIPSVNLQANIELAEGVVLIPKVDSFVIVTFLTKDRAFVSQFAELSKILVDTPEVIFNGGDNGGLINIEELKTQINKNSGAIDALLNLFSSWVVVPSDGGAALKTLSSTVLAGKSTADLSSIEDETVKH